jgi:alpha/beta hydrolase fold
MPFTVKKAELDRYEAGLDRAVALDLRGALGWFGADEDGATFRVSRYDGDRFVDAAGIEFAYRRFGRPAGVPLVMLQHFRGNLDNWDPALTDALAAEREIILVDYAGVGSSTGEPNGTIAETARQMIAFIGGLDLQRIDLLGFSIGGFVALSAASSSVRTAMRRRATLPATRSTTRSSAGASPTTARSSA